MDYSTTGSSDC